MGKKFLSAITGPVICTDYVNVGCSEGCTHPVLHISDTDTFVLLYNVIIGHNSYLNVSIVKIGNAEGRFEVASVLCLLRST